MAEKNSGKAGHDVFISYANDKSDSTKIDDRKVADMICSALEAENICCWIDHRDIVPGDDWQYAIAEAVEKAKIVVLVFSSIADKSQWVMDEIAIARDKKIRIIPFQIENVPSRGVFSALRARCQWIEAYIIPLEKHLDRLVNAVKIHLGKGTPHQLELNRPEDKKKTTGETRNAKPHKLRLFLLIVILLITTILFVKVQFLDKSFDPAKELINLKDSLVELRNTNNKEEIQSLKTDIIKINDSLLDELKKGRDPEKFQKELASLQIIRRDYENLVKKIELKSKYQINDDDRDPTEKAKKKFGEILFKAVSFVKELENASTLKKESIFYEMLISLYIGKEYFENQKLEEQVDFEKRYIRVLGIISEKEEELREVCKENNSSYTSVGKFFNPFSSLINKKAKSMMINSKGFWEADFGDDIIMVYIPPEKQV